MSAIMQFLLNIHFEVFYQGCYDKCLKMRFTGKENFEGANKIQRIYDEMIDEGMVGISNMIKIIISSLTYRSAGGK
jgi:hypothetical protein